MSQSEPLTVDAADLFGPLALVAQYVISQRLKVLDAEEGEPFWLLLSSAVLEILDAGLQALALRASGASGHKSSSVVCMLLAKLGMVLWGCWHWRLNVARRRAEVSRVDSISELFEAVRNLPIDLTRSSIDTCVVETIHRRLLPVDENHGSSPPSRGLPR